MDNDPLEDPLLTLLQGDRTADAGSVDVWVEIRGACMEPLIRDGDRVRARRMTAPTEPGEILLARDGDGQLTCHRVLGRGVVDRSHWLLAGDRTLRTEEHPESSVLGRVDAVERSGRRLTLDGPSAVDRTLVRWHRWSLAGWGRSRAWERLLARVSESLRSRVVEWRGRAIWRGIA